MAEDTTPAAEPAADEAPSELVTWKDSDGRKHTGARSGSAYKQHLAEQKLATAAEKAEAAAKSADTAETPEVAADVATVDAQSAAAVAPVGQGDDKAVLASADDGQAAADTTDAKGSPKPGRPSGARRV